MWAVADKLTFGIAVPPWAACLAAAGGAALWAALHYWPKRRGGFWPAAAMAVLRTGVGACALLAAAAAAERWLVLATNWPLWPIALAGAAATEAVVALYRLERRTAPRAIGTALAALRVSLVLLVTVMLVQPVRSVDQSLRCRRVAAVLVDESASMDVSDADRPAAARLRLAESFSVPAARRPTRLDAAARRLESLREALSAQADWLAMLGQAQGPSRAALWQGRKGGLIGQFQRAAQVAGDIAAQVAEVINKGPSLDAAVQSSLLDVKARLGMHVGERLADAAKALGAQEGPSGADQAGRLGEELARACAVLGELVPQLAHLADRVDEAVYAALSPADRQAVDQAAAGTRLELARRTLTHRPGPAGAPGGAANSLIERLGDYDLKFYTFASSAAEQSPARWSAAAPGPASSLPASTLATAPPAPAPAAPGQTDLAAALEKVALDTPAARLAGVLLLTDGRHNGPGDPLAAARRLGAAGVGVSSIVFGSERGPVDAAIVAVDAPDTVYLEDKLLAAVEVKLAGLAGQDVRIALWRGDKEADAKTLRAAGDNVRMKVELSDCPTEPGMHAYRLRIEPLAQEAVTSNNEYPLAVHVTKDRTRLLLIEGRPRWEFRYLKNLFADRDVSVQLQYVLLEPDQVAGMPPRPRTAASVARPADQPEATALPEGPEEWLKFDVIILGDVDPRQLTPADLGAMRRFVCDRGGTLVVISGPQFMPQAFAGTEMEDLMPVVPAALAAAQPEESFHIALTAEGRQHVIMRQRTDAEQNAALWDSLPEITWRSPVRQAKPAATVLAYALPPSPPEFLQAGGASSQPAPPDEQAAEQRRAFERTHPLISLQAVGVGRVLLLSFDRTWRMRYLVGDSYHHKFWGQVMRWATANKLPAGTETVRLGADRARYGPAEPVGVQARILRADLSPVVTAEAAVKVYAGRQLVLRKALQHNAEAPGNYAADLGEMPAGSYRMELDCPAARPLLEADNVQTVQTEFSVDPPMPPEQIELGSDRGLLNKLASAGGGVVLEADSAAEALQRLGPPDWTDKRTVTYVLWDCWPLLAAILMLATGEWLLRKKVGLA